MAGDEEDAYDIYLLRLSGVPIFAGCTGSDYCTEHMNNHELHSAFLSAIYSFSKEVSVGNPLKSIVFDTIQINIKVDEPNDLMIAVVHPRGVEPDKIRQQIDAAHDLFLEKYKKKMESGDPLDRKIIHKTFLRSVLEDVAKPMQMLRDRLATAFGRKD